MKKLGTIAEYFDVTPSKFSKLFDEVFGVDEDELRTIEEIFDISEKYNGKEQLLVMYLIGSYMVLMKQSEFDTIDSMVTRIITEA